MATKAKAKTRARTKTKTRAARARTAPAAKAQPAPQTAAPQPAPVALEPPGYRTPPGWNRRDVNPRPAGELNRTAELVRGVSYTISYSTGPVVFPYGVAVAINESEFQRLSAAVDKIDFQDPGKSACTVRSIMKFRFQTLDGDEIPMPAIPDVEGGPYAMSAGDRAEHERRFQGQEHTTR